LQGGFLHLRLRLQTGSPALPQSFLSIFLHFFYPGLPQFLRMHGGAPGSPQFLQLPLGFFLHVTVTGSSHFGSFTLSHPGPLSGTTTSSGYLVSVSPPEASSSSSGLDLLGFLGSTLGSVESTCLTLSGSFLSGSLVLTFVI
jgi:hypothetical protein